MLTACRKRIERESFMITIREYTGHIRNWRDLCPELGIASGLSREEREKEIIVKGYEKWGGDLGKHLHGMFAIILNDDAKDQTVCIRDPFGTRTLYYYITDDGKLLISFVSTSNVAADVNLCNIKLKKKKLEKAETKLHYTINNGFRMVE